jgi:tRNA G18 (ribose-2'-O)-methylase SpoU
MKKKVYILLHDLRSVHNVGSIFRTADAAGVTKIYLSGTTPTPLDRFQNKRKDFIKVSLGAEDSVLWEYVELDDFLKTHKGQLVAVEQDEKSVNYTKATIEDEVCLVFGAEVEGVNKEILKRADLIVEIPMAGEKESLNVSVTAGIILFSTIFPQK